MIRKAKRTTIFNRLEQLERLQQNKNFISVLCVDVEDTGFFTIGLGVDKKCFESMGDVEVYVKKLYGITDKTKWLIDDFCTTPDDLYLPSEPVWYFADLEQRRKIIELAASDSVQWLNSYIELLKTFFEINEIDYDPKIYSHTLAVGGRWLTDEELKQDNIEQQIKFRNIAIDVAKKTMQKYPAIVDLLEQFDKLSVPELLERYKDHKWFKKF